MFRRSANGTEKHIFHSTRHIFLSLTFLCYHHLPITSIPTPSPANKNQSNRGSAPNNSPLVAYRKSNRLLVFFMNQFPPNPRVFHLDRFEFFRKFAEIFASQGAPPVSTTPVANLPPVSTTPAAKFPLVPATVANFSTIFASVVDTGDKFATGVNDAGGNLPPVSATPAADLPPVANLELRISPRIFEKILNGPNGIIRGLGKIVSRKNQKQKIS